MEHHRCLDIYEILEHIFRLLSSREGGRHLRTLAALARTCKSFSEPALDLLWHSQTSLVPLISNLPPDAYSIEQLASRSHRLVN